MNHDAIVQDRDPSRADHLAAGKLGRGPEDLVGLPFAGPSTGIDQWRVLAIEGGRSAIRVRGVGVPVEYLELIHAHQQHPAVGSAIQVRLYVW